MPMYVFMVIKISHTMSHLTHTHPQTADRIDEHFPAMMLEKNAKHNSLRFWIETLACNSNRDLAHLFSTDFDFPAAHADMRARV